jgi:outer membrane protein TolC
VKFKIELTIHYFKYIFCNLQCQIYCLIKSKKMKKILCILCLLLNFTLYAQNIDYNRVILPDNTSDIEFSERLVQLAWSNHPTNQNIRESVEISRLAYKLTKRQWLQNFRISGNLNEFNVDPSRDIANRSQFLPRYNLSLGFNLGDLLLNPLQNKQSKVAIDLSENQVDAAKLAVRKNVLQAYNAYLLEEEIYKINRLAMDNAETNHAIVEESFEQGEETYESYNNSFTNLNQRKITLLRSETSLKNAQLLIEEMIGIPLEEIN